MGKERTWADNYREDPANKSRFQRYFVAIIGVCILILALIIAAVVNTALTDGNAGQKITAADTFAVSQVEQQQMSDYSTKFAQGVLIYAYCNDQQTALEGKNQALSVMANNTDSYTQVESMSQVSPTIAIDNILPVTTTPTLQTTTQAYAGEFVYEFDGAAADGSVTSTTNPDGTFADNGYHFTLTFSYVDDTNTGDKIWVISNAVVTAK